MEANGVGNIEQLIGHIESLQIPNFYISPEFEREVEPFISKKVLGEGGAASEVRKLTNGDYVVKITRPCAGNMSTEAVMRYCQDIKNPSSIRHNPSGDHKDLIELPNFLMEAIIGGYLRRLQTTNICPHFSYSLGVWINPSKNESYNLQPLYKTDLDNILTTIDSIYLFLFQAAFAFSIGQEVYRLTNYDTHLGNIFYVTTDINKSYPIVDKRGRIKHFGVDNLGWDIKIADFGLSRMETMNMVINATVDDYPIRTSGQFNHWYDIVGLLGSMLVSNGSLAQKIRKTLGDDEIGNIFSIVFKEKKEVILKDLNGFLNKFYDLSKPIGRWRPRGIPKIQYQNIPSMHYITNRFLNELAKRKIAKEVNMSDKNYEPILALPTYSLIVPKVVLGADEPVEGEQLKITTPYHEIINIAPGIIYNGYFVKYDKGDPSWEWTATSREQLLCPQKEQYIHVIYVDTKLAKENGYELKLECCKLDVLSYMSNNFGLAINGNFFDIGAKATKRPIGPYKDQRGKKSPDFITDLSIPEKYVNYYGGLDITNGKVSIHHGPPKKDNEHLYCGPLLVYNSQVIFTPKVLETVENIEGKEVKIFQCRDAPKGVKYVPPGLADQLLTFPGAAYCIPTSKFVNQYMPNCKEISPGELSHAGNPNPRTMILTRDPSDGKGDLAIVYVEGRDDRGMGLDLADLAALAHNFKAINALNLDGGRSSAMAWRTPESPDYIRTANPKHKDFYPVGNLITLGLRL